VARSGACEHRDAQGERGARIVHLEVLQPGAAGGPAPGSDWFHGRSARITLLALALGAELWHLDEPADLAVESQVLELLAEVREASPGGRNPLGTGPPPPWLARAREVLRDRYHEPLTVAAIAGELGVHRVTLARAFRRHYRVTQGVYLRQVRLARALRALGSATGSLSARCARSCATDREPLFGHAHSGISHLFVYILANRGVASHSA